MAGKIKETKRRARRTGKQDKIRTQWAVRRFRIGSPSDPAFVEFSFPTEDNGIGRLRVSHSELRHPRRLIDELSNRLPTFPADVELSDHGLMQFIRELIDSHAGKIELIPARTGFIDGTMFATHGDIITAGGTKRAIPVPAADGASTTMDVRGTLDGTRRGVLKLARQSNYLAFGIGVALAAPLATYMRLRRKADGENIILTETAAFNLSGKSSSGKSSVCRASLSLAGAPERMATLDFTSRGLAELAAASNDLLLGLDDTETANHEPGALVRALKTIAHTVPGGRSKYISKGVDQGKFPQLNWSTLVLSSSPRPIAELAADHDWLMSRGDQVRLFNIAVPGADKGGIFDRLDGSRAEQARRSVRLIERLERGYLNHCGHIFSRWVSYLLAKDRSDRIARDTAEFVRHVGAGHNGWEKRFAQKFGVVYAALRLGVSASLLPWPKALPLQAVSKCYYKARNAAQSEDERHQLMAARLCKRITRPHGMLDYSAHMGRANPPVVSRKCIAIRYQKNGRLTFGVFDDALLKVLRTRTAKSQFTDALARAGVIGKGHGHAGTIQERLPIRRGGTTIQKPHLWSLDIGRLLTFMDASRRAT